jgi:hypothetical protein
LNPLLQVAKILLLLFERLLAVSVLGLLFQDALLMLDLFINLD